MLQLTLRMTHNREYSNVRKSIFQELLCHKITSTFYFFRQLVMIHFEKSRELKNKIKKVANGRYIFLVRPIGHRI